MPIDWWLLLSSSIYQSTNERLVSFDKTQVRGSRGIFTCRGTGEPRYISCRLPRQRIHTDNAAYRARSYIWKVACYLYNVKLQTTSSKLRRSRHRTDGRNRLHASPFCNWCHLRLFLPIYRAIFPRQGARISKFFRWSQLFLNHHKITVGFFFLLSAIWAEFPDVNFLDTISYKMSNFSSFFILLVTIFSYLFYSNRF